MSAVSRFAGLKNTGNLCFANSSFQVQNAIATVRNKVLNSNNDNPIWTGLKKVFQHLQGPTRRSSRHPAYGLLRDEEFRDYWHDDGSLNQQDPADFIARIYNHSDDLFDELTLSTIEMERCESCGYYKETPATQLLLTLDASAVNPSLEISLQKKFTWQDETDRKCPNSNCKKKTMKQKNALVAISDQVFVSAVKVSLNPNDASNPIVNLNEYNFPTTLSFAANMFNDSSAELPRHQRYLLKAVIVRDDSDSAFRGHYWTYIKHPEQEQMWVRFEDDKVRIVNESDMLDETRAGDAPGSGVLFLYEKEGSDLVKAVKISEPDVDNEGSSEDESIEMDVVPTGNDDDAVNDADFVSLMKNLCTTVHADPNNKDAIKELAALLTPTPLYMPSCDLIDQFLKLVESDYADNDNLVVLTKYATDNQVQIHERFEEYLRSTGRITFEDGGENDKVVEAFQKRLGEDVDEGEQQEGIAAAPTAPTATTATTAPTTPTATTATTAPTTPTATIIINLKPLKDLRDKNKRVKYTYQETVRYEIEQDGLVMDEAETAAKDLRARIADIRRIFQKRLKKGLCPFDLDLLEEQLKHLKGRKSVRIILIVGMCPNKGEHIIHGRFAKSPTSRMVDYVVTELKRLLNLSDDDDVVFIFLDSTNECIRKENGDGCDFGHGRDGFDISTRLFKLLMALLVNEGFQLPSYIVTFGMAASDMIFGRRAWNGPNGRLDAVTDRRLFELVPRVQGQPEIQPVPGAVMYHISTIINPRFNQDRSNNELTQLWNDYDRISRATYRTLFFIDAVCQGIRTATASTDFAFPADEDLKRILVTVYNNVARKVKIGQTIEDPSRIQYPIINNGGTITGGRYQSMLETRNAGSRLGALRSIAIQKSRMTEEEWFKRFSDMGTDYWKSLIKKHGLKGARGVMAEKGKASVAKARASDPKGRDQMTKLHQESTPARTLEIATSGGKGQIVSAPQRQYYRRMASFERYYETSLDSDGKNPQLRIYGKRPRLNLDVVFPKAKKDDKYYYKFEFNSTNPVLTENDIRRIHPNWTPEQIERASSIGIIIVRDPTIPPGPENYVRKTGSDPGDWPVFCRWLYDEYVNFNILRRWTDQIEEGKRRWQDFHYFLPMPFDGESFLVDNFPDNINDYPHNPQKNESSILWRGSKSQAKKSRSVALEKMKNATATKTPSTSTTTTAPPSTSVTATVQLPRKRKSRATATKTTTTATVSTMPVESPALLPVVTRKRKRVESEAEGEEEEENEEFAEMEEKFFEGMDAIGDEDKDEEEDDDQSEQDIYHARYGAGV